MLPSFTGPASRPDPPTTTVMRHQSTKPWEEDGGRRARRAAVDQPSFVRLRRERQALEARPRYTENANAADERGDLERTTENRLLKRDSSGLEYEPCVFTTSIGSSVLFRPHGRCLPVPAADPARPSRAAQSQKIPSWPLISYCYLFHCIRVRCSAAASDSAVLRPLFSVRQNRGACIKL